MGEERQNLVSGDAGIDAGETEIVKIGEMVSTEPETSGVKAVQIPDPATHGAALEPEEIVFRDACFHKFPCPLQNGGADSLGILAVAAAGDQGTAVHRFKAAAEGAVDETFVVKLQIQGRRLAEEGFAGQIANDLLPDGFVAAAGGLAFET